MEIKIDIDEVSLKQKQHICLHSSQFQSLCSTKSSSETLQNLPYFVHTKTQSCFFRFSFCATLCHRPGHSLGKNIKLHKMKNRKSNFGFSYIMANFEAFRWNFSSSTSPEIGRSDQWMAALLSMLLVAVAAGCVHCY